MSNTTKIWFKRKPYNWTFYLDIYNNKIVGYNVRELKLGNGTLNHRMALKSMLEEKIKRGYKNLKTIFHIDQEAVCSSLSFNKIFVNTSIICSMFRAETPTDNPVIESKNEWLKKEIDIDFGINDNNTVPELIEDIVK